MSITIHVWNKNKENISDYQLKHDIPRAMKISMVSYQYVILIKKKMMKPKENLCFQLLTQDLVKVVMEVNRRPRRNQKMRICLTQLLLSLL